MFSMGKALRSQPIVPSDSEKAQMFGEDWLKTSLL